jgi:hypothetical protein
LSPPRYAHLPRNDPISHVLRFQEIRILVPYKSIMMEVEILKLLSGRLDVLAEQHPTFTETLFPISAGILRIATVLEVLVISRSDSRPV